MMINPLRIPRRVVGRTLRATGMMSLYERNVRPTADRLFHTLRYAQQPALLNFSGHHVQLKIDSAATLRFADLFSKNEVSLLGFILQSLAPGDCVWDIGANRGMFTL